MRPIALASLLAVTCGAANAADPVAPTAISYDEYGAVETSLTGTPGDPANGRLIMADRGQGNCIACHAVTDLEEFPFHGEVGPALDGVASRWQEADLRGIVANAKQIFPGTIMPAFYKVDGFVRPGRAFTGKSIPEEEIEPLLSAQQVEDVVAYLMTLQEG
jgi:sulfur-oxidizing protein SoxX